MLLPIVAAVVYALVGYLDKQVGESFDPLKMFVTACIGAVVGVVLYASGIPITSENVLMQMAAYAGLVAIVYKLLHAWVKRREE